MANSALAFVAPSGAQSSFTKSPPSAPTQHLDEGSGFAALLAQSREIHMAGLAFACVAPAGALSTFAESPTATPTESTEEVSGFAEVLAQSSEYTNSRAGSETVGGREFPLSDHGKKKAEAVETAASANAVGGSELGGLVAIANAEIPPTQLPAPVVDGNNITQATPAAIDGLQQTASLQAATASLTPVLTTAVPPAPASESQSGTITVVSPQILAAGGQVNVPGRLGRPARESTTPILATATVQGGSNQDNTGQPPSVNGVGREAPNSNPSSAATHEVGGECNALRLPPTDGASREVAIFSPSLAAQKATNGERSADQPVPTAAASREAPSAWSAIRDTHPHQAGSAESWNSNATSKTDDRAQFAALQLDPTPGANLVTGTAVHASGTHSMVSAGPSAILLVPTPVDSPAWSKDFGQHVIRLAADGQTTAEIHLNPADWGPIRVSIDIKDQDATLQFSAEHLHTREALENALPRLREMFAAGSLTLADANVTGQSPSQHFSDTKGQRFDQSTAAAGNARSLTLEVAEPTMVASHRPTVGRSRIDLFA